ncbi:MAG: D-alanine--poly(phosphoribitol) ligase, partial [Bryobacteraceae bacterium]
MEQADVDALIVDKEGLPQLQEVLRGIRRPPALLLPATDAASLARTLPGIVLDRHNLASAVPLATLPPVLSS